MTNRTVASLAFAAGCVLGLGTMPAAHAQDHPMQQQASISPPELVTNGPQASSGDFGDWSARRNVIESHQYDRLVATNRAFRQARMRRECGPIGDQQLHQQCLASFSKYEMNMARSGPRLKRQRFARATRE